MGRIHLLEDHVASQVAAGEVVERPASVLKELLENSLDSGATRITVRFSRGGRSLISVEDDGCGMDRDDALLALERHATSKIRSAEDLASVATHGFRGEALPSIASVSRFSLVSGISEDRPAVEILAEAGKIKEVNDAPVRKGTQISMRDLFFNVPARRKFLRSEATETAHLILQFETAAMARPDVHFELIRDAKILRRLPAATTQRVRAADLFGREIANQLVDAPQKEIDGFRFEGLLSLPGTLRGERSKLFIFVNGRSVQDAVILRAIRDAFSEKRSGQSDSLPVGIFRMELATKDFDCNVHPAKRELRFRQPARIREAIYEFVRDALQSGSTKRVQAPSTKKFPDPLQTPPPASTNIPPAKLTTSEPTTPAPPPPTSAPPIPKIFTPPAKAEAADLPGLPDPPPLSKNKTSPPSAQREPDTETFRFLGNLGERYLTLESEDGLVLLDIVHAMERISFEELCRTTAGNRVDSQHLLLPSLIENNQTLTAWLLEHAKLLDSIGFRVEAFGDGIVKVDEVPVFFSSSDPVQVLTDLAQEYESRERKSLKRALNERLLLATSRVRSRQTRLSHIRDAEAFLKKLLVCELPYASPSGQPTMLQMGWSELARKFGRTKG
ncbi:MAG: DNA mismatch repair endonuclease MutL [Chthoniobacterales bacterium]